MRVLNQAIAKGFTLLELMLVLGGISALSAGGFMVYKHVHQNTQATEEVEKARLLSNVLMQSYGQTGSFEGLSSESLVHGNLLPPTFRPKDGTLHNAWGGSLKVEPSDSSNRAFSATWNQVPSGACANMTSQLSKNFSKIQINGTEVKTPTQSLDVSRAAQLCGGSNQNQVTLVSDPVAAPDIGEVEPPQDRGNVPVHPPVNVPEVKSIDAKSVDAVDYGTYAPPTVAVLPAPTAPAVTPNVSGVDVNTPSNSSLPPTAPQFCRPSTTAVPVNTPETQEQPKSCPGGYTGQITERQSRTKTVTTTTIVSCSAEGAAVDISKTERTTYSVWTPWTEVTNTCAAMCSTRLGNGSYTQQVSYDWKPASTPCPSGYTGSHTYDAQTVSYNNASCANGSAPVDPVWGGWSAPVPTGTTRNDVNTCKRNDLHFVEAREGCGYNTYYSGSIGAAGMCTKADGSSVGITESGFWDAWDRDWMGTLPAQSVCTFSELLDKYYYNRDNGCAEDIRSPAPPATCSVPGQRYIWAEMSTRLDTGQSGQIQDAGTDDSQSYVVYVCQ